MEQWWNDSDRGNQSMQGKTRPIDTFSTADYS
jgi:hypothetical protein